LARANVQPVLFEFVNYIIFDGEIIIWYLNILMVKTDCAHFPLDRPCRFHKESGVKCSSCGKYLPVGSRGKTKKLLIIKIGAMGDVLRTTFLLEGLKKKYDGAEITWIVAQRAAPILEKNPLVSRVWYFDCGIFSKVAGESFDVCVNLDLAPESLGLATLACASEKLGFWLDDKRRVVCSGPDAKKWLAMSAFDDLKKKNTETYQRWMAQIAGLPESRYEIFTPLAASSLRKAADFKKKEGLAGRTVVGINPGAGGRWRFKKWTDSGYSRLIERLNARGVKVLLLGGPEEKGLVDKLKKISGGKAVSAGTDNSLLDFFALINLCDLVVTGDTLALHAALGLKKKVVAVFGPTSPAEIELYGRGTKIITPAKCVCCYLQDCDVRPDCMKLITPQRVIEAVEKWI